MSRVIYNLELDKTGLKPDNLIVNEKFELINLYNGYKGLILRDGGFYKRNFRLFDSDYNELILNTDFIMDYFHKEISEFLGLEVYSLIVLLEKDIEEVILKAQMVGGDVAYSFTVVEDYISFLESKGLDYIPKTGDYIGTESKYRPGELEILRWRLDTYQPFNNEIDNLRNANMGLFGNVEEELRLHIRTEHDTFMGRFTDEMIDHVNDMDNPHKTTKAQLGLGKLNNFDVASVAEAIELERNDVYLTPKRIWNSLEINAITPTNAHINKKGINDPHQTTLVQVNGVSETELRSGINKKYFKEEVVNNSDTGYFRNQNRTYGDIVREFRKDIPATSFKRGLINPRRMGIGNPNQNTVLTSEPQQWQNWNDLLHLVNKSAGYVVQASFGSGYSHGAANNFIASNAAFRSMPNNSLVIYNLYVRYQSNYNRSNGGEWHYSTWRPWASFKDSNGNWIPV